MIYNECEEIFLTEKQGMYDTIKELGENQLWNKDSTIKKESITLCCLTCCLMLTLS